MQLHADVLGIAVERLALSEATALGAAIGAGIGAGLWNAVHGAAQRRIDRTFEPRISADEREARFAQWQKDCAISSAVAS